MTTAEGESLYYVVLWNFECDESGELVREGVVFSDAAAAAKEATTKMIAELNYAFAPRVKPIFSARLGGMGYVAGEVSVRAVTAGCLNVALREALAGKGTEISWS